MATILGEAARADALKQVPDWQIAPDGSSLARVFTFRDFSEAFGFMARAALVAENMDHHPDWSNSYKRVEVRLSTHSAGGLTELDVRLARAIDALGR